MKRRLLVPETVQSSALDCGPAALHSLLAGFGIPSSYDDLRDACRTNVDGTSINDLEVVAREFGLEAKQVMIPADHIVLDEAKSLPAIVVVRNAAGATHFVVAWRCRAGLVQIMDPATGRRWQRTSDFLHDVYRHRTAVPASAWAAWAHTDDFLQPLDARLRRVRVSPARRHAWVERAKEDETGSTLARLDAAVRWVTSLVEAKALRRGSEAERAVDRILEQASPATDPPPAFWQVQPTEDPTRVHLHGAVLLRVRGVQTSPAAAGTTAESARRAPHSPGVFEFLKTSMGQKVPWPAVIAALLAGGGVALEGLVFRAWMELGVELPLATQRILTGVAAVLLSGIILGLEAPLFFRSQAMGRRSELSLRMAFFRKLVRLDDRYLSSRLVSDLVERAHRIAHLRKLPPLGAQLGRLLTGLVATTIGVVWLFPEGAALAIGAAVVSVAIPWLLRSVLTERDLRLRAHAGALTRFQLDALLGLTPARVHGAERALQREHEGLVTQWARASLGLQRSGLLVQEVTTLVGHSLVLWLVASYVVDRGASLGVLLLFYWAFQIPIFGQRIVERVRQIPEHRSVATRLSEPLAGPEEPECAGSPAASPSLASPLATECTRGMALSFERVSVEMSGVPVLRDLDLSIGPGSRVALIGPSGAGKSTLISVLLGFHRTQGRVRVDDKPLDEQLAHIRADTAWIDPAVTIWNRSMLENVRYGNPRDAASVPSQICRAELEDVVEWMPAGLATTLGEGGMLLSGGEGQRVRFARAFGRPEARLVLLDEATRGLDRDVRAALLDRVFEQWPHATILCVTHDLEQTERFDRVVFLEGGAIVQDGSPQELLEQPGRFAEAHRAWQASQSDIWGDTGWRRLLVRDGSLVDGVES
ncbi:MAG: ATP-binding cassette domain-containing protein [bacterium]